MLEKALHGSWRYWTLITVLSVMALIGVVVYLNQLTTGLVITGLSRDIPWGMYIAQLTFLVGVAASAVVVVAPYYLHDFKAFGRLTILGEFLAISAVIMCLLFVLVDLGQPFRMMNLFLYPSPNSPLFWDALVLSGYLFLNGLIAYVAITSEKKGIHPPAWIKPFIILSIPWAISIHTVTAFLYSGLSARPFWLTAVLAPRFLASAFASGPCLLILLCLVLRRFTRFDAGDVAIKKLSQIVTYALAANIFLVLVELFTALYSGIPHHVEQFQYLFFGLHGHNALVPFMWTSQILAVIALILLLIPKVRTNLKVLPLICVAIVVAIWIEKGLGMVVTGFIPSPLHKINEYTPTFPEGLITVGIYAIGFLLLTVFYKITISVREEDDA